MARIFAALLFLLAACAENIPKIAYYDGQRIIIKLRGTHKGKPVLVRRYFRSNGWTETLVADVFIGGHWWKHLLFNE